MCTDDRQGSTAQNEQHARNDEQRANPAQVDEAQKASQQGDDGFCKVGNAAAEEQHDTRKQEKEIPNLFVLYHNFFVLCYTSSVFQTFVPAYLRRAIVCFMIGVARTRQVSTPQS